MKNKEKEEKTIDIEDVKYQFDIDVETKKKSSKDKYVELEEKYFRVLAELKDLHKTYQNENKISLKYVKHDLMLELIPLYDIFSMVLENENVSEDAKAYLQGFKLVFNQFKQILNDQQVSEISAKVGDQFDYQIHNAIESEITDDEKLVNTISKVFKKGFMIDKTILRPAGVKVYVARCEDRNDLEENLNQEENSVIEEKKGEN